MKRDQQLLVAAADLIERTGWTQGRWARRANGTGCRIASPAAARFDITGAFYRAAIDGGYAEKSRRAALDRISKVIGTGMFWNDRLPRRTGKATVIATLREAATL